MLADRSRRSAIPGQPASLIGLGALVPVAPPAGAASTVDQPWVPTDAAAALGYVQESLDARVTARRREMVEELVAARTEAATQVRAAQREATAIVHAAGAELIAALLNGAANPQFSDAPPALVEAAPLLEPPSTASPTVRLEGPAASTHQSLPQRAGPRGLRRFVHLDTVLPLVAIMILLVVLLAWVG